MTVGSLRSDLPHVRIEPQRPRLPNHPCTDGTGTTPLPAGFLAAENLPTAETTALFDHDPDAHVGRVYFGARQIGQAVRTGWPGTRVSR